MDNIKIIPQKTIDLDVRVVKITEQEEVLYNVTTVSASYTALKNDRYIFVDTACTVTLPTVNFGKIFTIKNIASSGTVTVDGGDYNIEGSSTTTLANQYDWTTLIFNGTEWNNV